MDALIERFNGLVAELLTDLETVYPEQKGTIEQAKQTWEIGSGLQSRKYFNYFATNILSHSNELTQKSVEAINKLDIIPGISLGFIFNEPGHEANAEIVWKYLAALSLISTHIFQEAQKEISKAETPEDIVNQMKSVGFNEEFFAEQSKAFMKILESATPKADGDIPESAKPNVPPEMEKVADQLFGGMIGNLAKEIAQEINPGDLNIDPNNPQALLQNLFSNDNNNLMNLVRNISGKLQQKLDNGQLDQNALFNEASSIMTNMQNMPGMADMMKGGMPMGGMPGLDPSMMAGLMSGLMGGGGLGSKKKDTTKNLTLLPKNHPKRRKGGK